MHIPVMLGEVLAALGPGPGKTFIDGTFGGGGYSAALLEAGAKVIAFDRDPAVCAAAENLARRHKGFSFHNARFSRIPEYVKEPADGLVLDLGVSSGQIDDPARGFSYTKDGPLAMTMGENRLSAADVVNKYDEARLAEVLRRYGELPRARALARRIIAARPIETTLALAALVGKEAMSRAFQAIRIEVNDELGELSRLLGLAHELVKPGGRLVAVSFHSLEDRIVKSFLAPAGPSRYSPAPAAIKRFQADPKNAILPGRGEVAANPRAASAKLRRGIRVV